MRGAPLYTREEFESGEDARRDDYLEKARNEAWKRYNAVRPRGDIDRGAAFQAGWAAAMRSRAST